MSNARDWKDRVEAAVSRFLETTDLSGDDEADRLFNNLVALLTTRIGELEQDKTDLIGQMNRAKLAMESIGRWLNRDDMAGVPIPISAALALGDLRVRLAGRIKAIEEHRK